MIIESRPELLMLMISLENSSELILEHERAQEWHKDTFIRLFNRITEEYNEIADSQESHEVALLVEGYDPYND